MYTVIHVARKPTRTLATILTASHSACFCFYILNLNFRQASYIKCNVSRMYIVKPRHSRKSVKTPRMEIVITHKLASNIFYAMKCHLIYLQPIYIEFHSSHVAFRVYI